MTTLADALADPPLTKARCHTGQVLERLEPDDRQALTDAMAGPASSAHIVGALRKALGVQLAAGSMQRHRKGECKCGEA